jgi:hypothetical protein
VYWTIDIVKIPYKYVCRPLVFTVLIGDVELFNSITIDRSLVPVNDRVVTVDPYSLLVMQNGKCKDLSIKFLLSGYPTVQIDHLFNSNTRAISILSICDVKPFVPTFYFHCKI